MFRIEFDTDSEAFDDGLDAEESARILRDVARKLSDGHTSGKVRDVNGNSVGTWKLGDSGANDDVVKGVKLGTQAAVEECKRWRDDHCSHQRRLVDQIIAGIIVLDHDAVAGGAA